MHLPQWLATLHKLLGVVVMSAVLSRIVAFCNKWAANVLPLNFPLKRPRTVLMELKQQGIQKAKGYSGGGHSTGAAVHGTLLSAHLKDNVSFYTSATMIFRNKILWRENTVWFYWHTQKYNDLNNKCVQLSNHSSCSWSIQRKPFVTNSQFEKPIHLVLFLSTCYTYQQYRSGTAFESLRVRVNGNFLKINPFYFFSQCFFINFPINTTLTMTVYSFIHHLHCDMFRPLITVFTG